jgi:RNA polymerase sigma-70 factor, ECF subfamily
MKQLSQVAQPEWSEKEAIEAAKGGDAAAFEFLYKAHCKHVYAVCLRMLRCPADAEDVTQQAFLQVFRRISSFRGEAAFGTWLHRVTVNLVLMHLRKNRCHETLTTSLEEELESGVGIPGLEARETASRTIDRLDLEKALEELAPGYKRALLLHDVLGYQHNEIAGLLKCSLGSSKSQLHKARKRMLDLVASN